MKQRPNFFHRYILAPLLAGILWLWSKTLRVSYAPGSEIILNKKTMPYGIYAVWHSRLFVLAPLFSFRQICGLISMSDDGQLFAGVLRYLGYRSILGSSSRGGARALLQMVRQAPLHDRYVIAVDGPRGPRELVKPGIVMLSHLLQKPIIPLSCVCESFWQVKSWDAHQIPKPFSRVTIKVEKMLYTHTREAQQEQDCRSLETLLRQASAL